MDGWQDEVLRLPEDIVPPGFMWRPAASGKESVLENRAAVIYEHYEQIREFLNDNGYGALTRLSNRLEKRQSRLAEKLSALESRLLFVRAQQRAFRDWYVEIDSSLGSAGSDSSETLRETKIGEAFLIEEGYEPAVPEGAAWKVNWETGKGREKALDRMQISYHPSDEEVGPSSQVLSPDFDSADLHPLDTLVFSGDKTWAGVFEQFEDRITALGRRKSKLRKTQDLLGFRLGIAETVLYQVEAFGPVTEMTEEKAEELASQSGPGRPSRLDEPESVLEVLNAVCEWLDGDPPPHFRSSKNDRGLANFVASKVEMLSVGGAKSFLMEIFSQLKQEYPALPVPSLESATSGQAYIEKAQEIRNLRDEYEREVVSKNDR